MTTKYRLLQKIKDPAVSLLFILLLTSWATAQSGAPPQSTRICPLNEQPLPAALKIRSVKVLGRRGVGAIQKQLETDLIGKAYTRDLHRRAMEKVEFALTEEANNAFEKESGIVGGARSTKLGVMALRTDPCVEIDESAKSVEVIIRVLFLRADLSNLANNLLPLPRSLAPSFYNKMPPFLRAFNPQMNFAYDRRTGPLSSLDLSTNLAELPALWRGGELRNSNLRVDLGVSGQKSLNKQFYWTKTDLRLSKLGPGRLLEKLDFILGFRASNLPLSEMRQNKTQLQFGGEVKLRPRLGLLNALHLSGSYSRNTNRLYDQGIQNVNESDDKGDFRSLVDGRVWNGFTRAAVWFDATKVRNSSTRYRRLAGLLGYQKEIGSGTQTVGIEAVVGGGRAWGSVPLYARFFGGNNTGSWLYESPESATLTDFPRGPLLRSYGNSEAGVRSPGGTVRGGKSYWHTNLSLTIPVRPWSHPLIPDETVVFDDKDTGEKKELTLSQLLENFTIGSAVGGIGDDLLDGIIEELMKQDPTLDEDAAALKGARIAEERARRVVDKEISPTMRFIARRANLFAVKPLVMLDAAKIGGLEGQQERLRFAAGGGLQFVIVIARAELGYVRSLPRITSEPKGNFIFRLTFQNLF